MAKDEITIDFSKIKNIFKAKEVSGEVKSFTDFFKKHYMIFLVLIPLFLAVFTRLPPAYLPITDDWATSAVYSRIQSDITAQVNAQYPTLPDANKRTLIDTNMQQILATQQAQVDAQIEQTSLYFKSQLKNQAGYTYLVAIDPYFYYRKAADFFKNGFDNDIEYNGMYIDTHIIAGYPLEFRKGGTKKIGNLNTWVIVQFHRLRQLFNPNADLMGSTFFVPIIIASLAVIPAFFIGRKVGGNLGGLFASVFLAVHPSFVTRTSGGFADTDAYNVTFPLFIFWLFIEAFEAKDIKKKILYGGLAGLLTGIFSYAWHGWWYITYFIIAAIIWYLAYWIAKELVAGKSLKDILHAKQIRDAGINILTIFVTTIIGGTLINGFNTTIYLFTQGPLQFIRFKDVATITLWPNVFTTVAEQNALPLSGVISQISFGSSIIFVLGMLGVAATLISLKNIKRDAIFLAAVAVWYAILINIDNVITNVFVFLALALVPILYKMIHSIIRKEEGVDIKYAVFLIIWMVATIWASTRGVRYVLLLVPAFAIGFGVSIGLLHRMTTRWISRELDVKKVIASVVLIVLFSLLLLKPIRAGYDTGYHEIPSYNDAWDGVLKQINEDSQPDAIINSWWDFGHWFEAMADRAATLDGGRQNNPAAHWLGKLMLTDNETLSVGILRMLDCGSNTAFDKLENFTGGDVVHSIDILNDIMVMDRESAKGYLLEHFSPEQTDEVLEYSHCDPPADYFITSEDMVSKSGVWAHFGAWDFRRSKMANQVRKMSKANAVEYLISEFGLDEETADKYYYEIQTQDPNNWIAPWPSYAGRDAPCQKTGNELICPFSQYSLNFRVNLDTYDIYADTPQGKVSPVSVVYMDGNTFKEKVFTGANIGFSMGIIKKGENAYNFVIMEPSLAKSIFTRTFFFQDPSLRHFKLFTSAFTVTGDDIYVWKIDWEGQDLPVEEVGNESEEVMTVEPQINTTEEKPVDQEPDLGSNIGTE